MNHARSSDFETVMSFFKENRKVFPHVRSDKIKRQIHDRQVILENDVVITYQIYKRKVRLGPIGFILGMDGVVASKGDCVLHQIVAKTKGNGSAIEVIRDFFDEVNTNVFLTVRADNERAIRFYNKVGMDRVGLTSWSGGRIPGEIYCKRHEGGDFEDIEETDRLEDIE